MARTLFPNMQKMCSVDGRYNVLMAVSRMQSSTVIKIRHHGENKAMGTNEKASPETRGRGANGRGFLPGPRRGVLSIKPLWICCLPFLTIRGPLGACQESGRILRMYSVRTRTEKKILFFLKQEKECMKKLVFY